MSADVARTPPHVSRGGWVVRPRCMFGSDWPVSTPASTYRPWVDLVVDATADLTAAECSAIVNDTARRIYDRTDQERRP